MNLLIGAFGGYRSGEASIILGDFAIGSILDPVGNFILNSDCVRVRSDSE